MTAIPALTKTPAQVFPDNTTIVPSEVRTLLEELRQGLDSALNRAALIGGVFVCSVAGNVLTVAIKTFDGNDPSTSKPVYADFRHTSQANGQTGILTITAACELTISGGATMGFTDAVSGRLWFTLFNDGGTPRIGAVNCRGTHGSIYGLYPGLLYSSTNEAGDGSADSAGVIYTDTAVTSKPMIILGHATWETALTTAGLWSSAPDTVAQHRHGDPRPGDILQRRGNYETAVDSTTTQTPLDDTIPQLSTEGKTFLSQAITFLSKANVYDVEIEANFALLAASSCVMSLHQDSTENALAAHSQRADSANASFLMTLKYRGLTAVVTSTTFKMNAGPSSATTLTFNGANATRTFGDVNQSRIEVLERMA